MKTFLKIGGRFTKKNGKHNVMSKVSKNISCFLYFPEIEAKYDSVFLCTISGAEWDSLRSWSMQNSEYLLIKKVLDDKFPIRLTRSQVIDLNEECSSVDLDLFKADALSGFAAFSLFLDHASKQDNAGVLFEDEANL